MFGKAGFLVDAIIFQPVLPFASPHHRGTTAHSTTVITGHALVHRHDLSLGDAELVGNVRDLFGFEITLVNGLNLALDRAG